METKVGLAIAMITVGNTGPLRSASLVQMSLWDKGASAEMPTGLAHAAPGVDVSKGNDGDRATPGALEGRKRLLQCESYSKDTVHKILADPSKLLPCIDAGSRVDEDKAGDKGEVSELDPGKSGSLTVDLKAGRYLLICNVLGVTTVPTCGPNLRSIHKVGRLLDGNPRLVFQNSGGGQDR